MAHISMATRGLLDIEDRNWDKAIIRLSKALQGSPNPAWLLARSKALVSVGRFEEALDDANLAFHNAYDRNKRDLMIEAHYRRGVAYFRLGQYANADCCAMYSMRLVHGHAALDKEDIRKENSDENGFWKASLKEATDEAKEEAGTRVYQEGALMGTPPPHAAIWRQASSLRLQALAAMNRLPADDEGRKATVSLQPERKELAALQADEKIEEVSYVEEPVVVLPTDGPPRLQDYQTRLYISVSIFSKGLNEDKLHVEFLPDSVHLNYLIYPNGEEKEFLLETYGQIDPDNSRYNVTPSKIELRLAKKVPGKWPQITKDKSEAKEAAENDKELQAPEEARKRAMDDADAKAKETKAAPAAETGNGNSPPAPPAHDHAPAHAYPSSSRSGPKNWDKIGEEEDEEDSSVNDFFKKLYMGATPEQQRAMMKSFVESNGTSLSTDWNDVGSRTVETVPPEGVEAKKW
ncbi:oxidosqualene:lanosterol cyclase [Pochonia chlamydosporia 170]|uniref:Oxidosqualene:lanosterol cyclase n=1 Tax=Pochonia chlamydosporia 170 TaxID=1380566 RepID=A0A179FHY9_METCM|nr:oxidosqualene:lanosterol cyclase [Pochonia chlamydosporia 170]OAQ65176.1 oxidosqualene:lanosterol cyclase [Pochonia chlamydosporia 170]